MTTTLVAMVMVSAVATTLSLLAYLPALAIVESIPPRRADSRAAVWFCALHLPLLAGLVGAAVGLHSLLTDPYGSPHLTQVRPHLCSAWVAQAPDGAWLLGLVGTAVGAVYAAALLRLILGAWRSRETVRRFAPAAQSTVVTVDYPQAFLATIGLLKPLIVTTTGTCEMLAPSELEAALTHEAAHLKRRDNLLDLLASAATTCLIYVPTAHLYLRYYREEIERACDDQAAAKVTPATVSSAILKLASVAEEIARERILPSTSYRGKHAAADVRRRAARLTTLGARTPTRTGGFSLAGAALVLGALVVLALTMAATLQQVTDTLRCLAESLVQVLA